MEAAARGARTQEAMRAWVQMERQQRSLETQQAVRDFVVNTLLPEAGIMLATTIISAGTMTAFAAAWRVGTGIQLASRIVFAAEVALSIPVGQAVDRALGRPVDDSFLGAMKQAGMMAGMGLASRALGTVGARVFNELRTRLGFPIQRLPQAMLAGGSWGQHQRLVTKALRNANAGRPIGVQVSLDVTNRNTGQTVRIVIDNLVPQGTAANLTYQLVDAKFSRVYDLTSPTVNLARTVTVNQRVAFDWIRTGQPLTVIPRGGNARRAGLTPGTPITLTPGVQIHVNGPNGIVVRQY
ncbi:MAG: hypothetical protein HYX68_06690 [Planctomycetes bacterium]|nr:hypothetical protein [Planctomycetota bacterium]